MTALLWLGVLVVIGGLIVRWVRRLPVSPSNGRRTSSGDSGFGSDVLFFGAADSGSADSTVSDSGSFEGGSSDGGSGGDGGGGSSTAD